MIGMKDIKEVSVLRMKDMKEVEVWLEWKTLKKYMYA